MNPEPLFKASVRVLRSYDYCHFEVQLSSVGRVPDVGMIEPGMTLAEVDLLRKEAARLADKAVEQYKIAKAAHERRDNIEQKWRLTDAQNTPEENRTPEQKAIIKYHADANFRAKFDYDYQDDYEPEVELE